MYRNKISCKTIVLSVLILTLGMGVSTNLASTWTNAANDDDWFNSANWIDGGDFSGGDGEAPNVKRSIGAAIGAVPLNFNSARATSLYMIVNNDVTITGGDLTYLGDGLWGSRIGGGSGGPDKVTVIQTGGTVTQTGGGAGFLIGHNVGDANNPTSYNISGGQLILERGCATLTIDFMHDGNPSNVAELNISGDAVVEVKGRIGFVMGPQGTLNVSGSGLLIWRDHTLEDLEGDISFLGYEGPRIDPNAVINALPLQVGPDVHFIDPDREKAKSPNPANKATDVVTDPVLEWLPGQFAHTHDVYFGTDFNDVNDANRANPLDVLVSESQDANSFDPGGLALGQTYYWRIDEVNAPPDLTIFKGFVWTFTTEAVGYPVLSQNIIATASGVSGDPNTGPEKTVDGSGLDADDLHSVTDADMWLSAEGDPNATWIQYEFDRIYKLHQMLVWNYNSLLESATDLGIKEATVAYSVDGTTWKTLGTTHEFAQAPGAPGYAANTTVALGGVSAKYIRIAAHSNWGGLLDQYGLSEVRFLYTPVWARESNPASGATGVNVDNVTLRWRAGRESASHELYFSSDQQAVIDETVNPMSFPALGSYTSYDTGELVLGQTYHWKINEVNTTETPGTWSGDLWHFSTRECLVVDDIERYNNRDTEDPESNRIYTVWMDGFEDPTANGSVLGLPEDPINPPYTESTVVHGGRQAMSFIYDNSTANYSEITVNVADLQTNQDWNVYGIETLSLWFYGDPCNVPQQMYVTVNDSKVLYDRDAGNLNRLGWQPWHIPLADFGVDTGDVTELGIGFDPIGMTRGSGRVLFDDIRLYAYSREMITPVLPGSAGLITYYALDGNADDSSGNGHHGTTGDDPNSTPEWVVDGQIDGALDVDGVADQIDCGNVNVTATGSISIACWVKPDNVATNFSGIVSKWGDTDHTFWFGQHLTDGWMRYGIYLDGGTVETVLDAEEIVLLNNQWTHIACTYDGHHQKIYANGLLVATSEDLDMPLTNYDGTLRLGNVPGGNYFDGLIDDVRIYDRSLQDAEIAGLAGRAEAFDKPF